MTFRQYGFKPWGKYINILDEKYTKVKQIVIKPGESPSYQYHHKRSEIWVIVQGTVEVRLDDEIKTYGVGDHKHIAEINQELTNSNKDVKVEITTDEDGFTANEEIEIAADDIMDFSEGNPFGTP